MRVLLDDTGDLTNQLVNLFHLMPDDLKANYDESIRASELVEKAIERIMYLKEALESMSDHLEIDNIFKESKSTQTSNVSILSPTINPKPQGLPSNQTILVQPQQQQVQKPLTVMAKDPKTGAVRPLTLFPKNIVRQPGGITTIQIGQVANQIRLAPPSGATPSSSAFGNNQVIVRQPLLLPQTTIDDNHGLICKYGCKCAVMNGGPIDDKLKKKLLAFLKRCTKIPQSDAETFLTYTWIQEDIFSLLLANLARSSFFQFCRTVSFTQAGNYDGEKKKCIIIKKSTANLTEGKIFIKGQTYTVPAVLVKLFREGQESHSLSSSLFLESQPDCVMTSDAAVRKNYICLNPFHYENTGRTFSYSAHTYPQSHHCQSYSRLLCTGGSYQVICKTCRKVQSISGDGPTVSTTSSSSTAPSLLKAKVNNADVTIEQLDNEFQDMLDDLEEQVADESDDDEAPPLKIDELVDDNQPNQVSDESSDNSHEVTEDDYSNPTEIIPVEIKVGSKRPLEDSTNIVESMPKPKIDDSQKSYLEEKGNNYQCWQCLSWFQAKEELKTHSCLNELNITGNIMFTCNFCATCSDDIDELRPHVARCKKFNLGPLKCYLKCESAMTSTIGSVKDSSRATRGGAKKSDCKCDSCGAVFPSKSELVLHNSSLKCKSFTCVKCQKNYATERTLKQHLCSTTPIQGESLGKRVDQDIKVIKLDRSKINHQPAKCVRCHNLLQSYELLKAHQTLSNFCGTCKQKFNTMCDLIQHSCEGPPVSNPPKKIKLKAEATGGPLVILKNIDDGNVPAIVDDFDAADDEEKSLASKKKNK